MKNNDIIQYDSFNPEMMQRVLNPKTWLLERIIPCRIDIKSDGKKGLKFPMDWTNFNIPVDQLNTDRLEINAQAVRTGNGIVMVDIDTKDLSALDRDISDWVKERLAMIDTFTVETTKGYHFYFKCDENMANQVRVSNHVDIRADGGCGIIATNNSEFSYRVINDVEPIKLPPFAYKMMKAKTATSYTFDAEGLRIREVDREPNIALFKAVESGDINRIIKATGMSPLDFTTQGMVHAKFNIFYFILANEPSVRNEDVGAILKLLVTKVMGFDWNSSKTQEHYRNCTSTMIWAKEYIEPESDFKDITSVGSFIERFSLSDKALESMGDSEVNIIDNVFFQGQICLIIARPNAGKTLLAKTWSQIIAQKGYKLIYVYEDADMKGYKDLALTGKNYGFDVIASFAKVGTTAQDILKALHDLAESDEELSNVVIVLDTLKKFTEVLDKKANKELFNILRKLTVKSGSILILGHANKYLSNEGNLVYEGTGDILADVDSMYMMYDDGNKHAESKKYITLEREKNRSVSAVREISYSLDLKTYTAEKCDEVIDTRKMLQQNLLYYSSKDKVKFVKSLIEEGITVQKEIIASLQEHFPLGRDKAHQFLISLTGHSWIIEKEAGFGRTIHYRIINDNTEWEDF